MRRECAVFFGISILVLCNILLFVAQASADQPADQAVSLGDIVVTATRTPQPISQISSHVTVIGREEIETSAARTIGELLSEKNLGHIQKYPGALTSVGIRGFRTDTHGNDLQSHVLVLLDGRRAGTGNLAKLLTINVDRIEIISGPGAVQYGSSGMGGVINVITRKGDANSVSMEGGGGNFGLAKGSAGATLKADGFDFAGAFEVSSWGNYKDGDGNEYYNTDIDYEAATSINTGYEFMAGNRIGAVFTYYNANNVGAPGYITRNDHDDYTDKRHWSLDFRYNGQVTDGRFKWMARGFLGEDDDDFTDPMHSDPDGWDTGKTSVNDTNQYGAQAQATGSFGPLSLTAGLDWIKYDITASWDPRDSEYDNPALFMISSLGLLDDELILTLGMRYDWYSVEVNSSNHNDEDETHFTPMVGMAWQLMDGLKLRAQYAQGFMMPSAWQLAGYSASSWGITRGNPDLDPEKSHTYEGGIDYMKAGISASLTYFYTDFKDKIESVYLSDGSSSWDNIGSATMEGLEMALSYDIGEPLGLAWEIRPYFNMTWLTDYHDDDTDKHLLYTSAVNLSSGIAVSDSDRLSARVNVAYTSGQDVQDWASGQYPAPVINMDGFTVVDLAGEYCLLRTAKFGDFSVKGQVRNLFDEEYAYVKDYPMPGTNFYLGLRWDY